MNRNENDLYVVPFDFTQATKDALAYALKLAHLGGGRVMLIHLVDKQFDIKNAQEKMQWEIDHLAEEDKVLCDSRAVVGDIFTDIDKIAAAQDATMIVMGTHSPTGLRKIFGSKSLKVLQDSVTPFIMIQEGQVKDHIESIVMPFSFDRESLQVTQVAAMLAHKYDATIHLVGYRDDDEWLYRDVITNEAVVRKVLNQHDIKHDTKILPGEKGYEEELFEYANSVNADLIAASYFHKGLRTYLHSFVQVLLENDSKIPVLAINAPELMTLNSRFSFITT